MILPARCVPRHAKDGAGDPDLGDQMHQRVWHGACTPRFASPPSCIPALMAPLFKYREGDIPTVPGALGLRTLGQLLPRWALHPAAAGASRPAWGDPRGGTSPGSGGALRQRAGVSRCPRRLEAKRAPQRAGNTTMLIRADGPHPPCQALSLVLLAEAPARRQRPLPPALDVRGFLAPTGCCVPSPAISLPCPCIPSED